MQEQVLETLLWGLGLELMRLGLVARSTGLEIAWCSQATVDLTGNLGMMLVDSSHGSGVFHRVPHVEVRVWACHTSTLTPCLSARDLTVSLG